MSKGTDHRVRLLTINAQLMSFPEGLLNPGEVTLRAHKLANALLNDRSQDIICLNEVFFEEARQILVSRLSSEWPFQAKKLGPVRRLPWPEITAAIAAILAPLGPAHPLAVLGLAAATRAILGSIELPEDSGLMVFSRFPIEHKKFVSYNDYEDVDRWADKGVALLRIRRSPTVVINLAVTHLQAAYKDLTQYSGVRLRQLQQVQALIQAEGAPDHGVGDRSMTLVAGDINIHGNFTDNDGKKMARSEWDKTFVTGGALPWYTHAMQDGWENFVSRSGRPNDPGITSRGRLEDSTEFVQSRLDYILLRKTDHPDPQERPEFAVQRMKLAHQGISDHIGVAAEVNLHHEYCYPRQALTIAQAIQLPDIGQVSPDSGQFVAQLDNAGMSWLRIKKDGTYSVTADANTAFELYSPDNLSTPLAVRYQTDLSQIPGSEGSWGDRDLSGTWGGPLQTSALTFAIPLEDFFIRVFRRDDADGPVRVGWYRHRGTNQQDALFQKPQAAATTPEFGGTPPPTEFWYRSRVRRAKSGDVHDSTLRVLNPKGFRLAVRVLQGSSGSTLLELLRTESSSREIDQRLTHAGGIDVFVAIRRSDPSDQPFSFRWFTALNFVINRFDQPMELRCVDETGWDILGGDEITLEIDPDSQNMPLRLIDDLEGVDSGEVLMVPENAFLPEMTGFQQDLGVKVVESEVGADDVATNTVPTMAFDEELKRVDSTLKPGSGEYSLHMTLARDPVR